MRKICVFTSTHLSPEFGMTIQEIRDDGFVEEKLPKFKEIFPKYHDLKLLGGMGALVVKDDVSCYAEKAGLYVLTQTSEDGAALTNRKNFRAKEFN